MPTMGFPSFLLLSAGVAARIVGSAISLAVGSARSPKDQAK